VTVGQNGIASSGNGIMPRRFSGRRPIREKGGLDVPSDVVGSDRSRSDVLAMDLGAGTWVR